MAIEITYLGHSGVLLAGGGQTVAIDPFLTGNPAAKLTPDQVRCDAIVLTHGHADHLGDTVAIAKRTGATVYAPFEVTEYLGEQGITKLEGGNPGGPIAAPFGSVAFTPAWHSSSIGGRYMGVACGAVVRVGDVAVYHCGDTALFSDMRLIGELHKPTVMLVPIGGRFTMDAREATRAVEFVKPRVAIPIHYNTWPPIEQDPALLRPAGVEVKVLASGERWRMG